MIKELKEMGIELMVSIWPTVDKTCENYEEMLEKMDLIQDVRDGEQQIERGEGLSHEAAKHHVLLKLKT